MRCLPLLVAATVACGHKGPDVSRPEIAPAYTATRWLPDKPRYAVAAKTVRDAQRSFADAVAVFGPLIGADVDAAAVSSVLERILRVDPLSPDAVAAIGVDVDGGIAVFSEHINPTFVVHLAAPAQFQAFLAKQADLQTQSVVTGGIEVFTTRLPASVSLSWAVSGEWLFVHFGLPFAPDDSATWFAASHDRRSPAWGADWQWAQQSAAAGREPPLLGFIDLRGIASAISDRVPDAAACAGLLAPVERAGVAIEGDMKTVAARFALDVGAAGDGIAKSLLPPPQGWSKAAEKAALAMQWNADLRTVRSWVSPCLETVNVAMPDLERFGVRAGRAQLTSFSADDKAGTGAIALDLAHKKFFASLLDDIPLRSVIEKKRTFGPHSGRSLAVPLGPTVDYVLSDVLALAAVGGGMMQAMVGTGPGAPTSTVFALDLVPGALDRRDWEELFALVELRDGKRITEHMMAWQRANLALTIDGPRLVLGASGQRR
jgi:hypothetical protein